MKTVLFDLLNAQPSRTSKFHGGGEYIKSIFEHFVVSFSDKTRIIAFYDETRYLDNWIKELIQDKQVRVFLVHGVEEVKNICTENQIDIFFSGLPEYYKREWFTPETRIVGTIHGLRKIEKGHDKFEYKYCSGKARTKALFRNVKWNLKSMSEKAVAKAVVNQKKVIEMLDEIVCVSWHTYYALKYYYPDIPEKKIHLFYSPAKNVEIEECDLQDRMVQDRYILLIGGDRWLKNSYRALKAIDALYDKDFLKGIATVLVGNTTDEIKKELKHGERFRWMSYVETSELENLYRYCEVFVYPSLNEGFGYPPIEAMKYGTTCVVSAICSLPEVCGNAVYYVNPYDIPEIGNRILHAVHEKMYVETVKKQMDYITEKQDKDLRDICSFLVNGVR